LALIRSGAARPAIQEATAPARQMLGLKPQRFLEPLPEALPRTVFGVHRIVMNSAPRFFFMAPSQDLFGRPFSAPDNPAAPNDVVRLARLLPVSHRGPHAGLSRYFLHSPFCRPERRADLCAAAARAKMRGSAVFLGHV